MKVRMFAAVIMTIGCVGGASACQPMDQRCKDSSALVAKLGYKEKLKSAQMECRLARMSERPEDVARQRPMVLMGLKPTDKRWPEVVEAFEQYIEEACGGEELIGLLMEGYRISWDRQLPGDSLKKALDATLGEAEMASSRQAVTAEVRRVLTGMLDGMVKLATSNYGARIKGVVTGEAADVAGGALCTPESEPH